VAGGLVKSAPLMQIYADVTRRPLSVIGSGRRERGHAPAARHPRPGQEGGQTFRSVARRASGRRAGGAPERAVKRSAREGGRKLSTAESAELVALRETVCTLHAELVGNNLVAWTSGNVSARLGDLMVIKPSGVFYDDLTPESMVVCDLDGKPVAPRGPSPSSDTATHAYIYRHMPEVGGVVHTHSTYATAWAARGRFARLPLAAASSLMAKGYGYAAEGDVLTACLVAAGPAPRGDEPGPPRRRLEGVLPAHRHRIRPGLGREEHDRGPLPAVSRGFVSTMMTRPFGVGLVGPMGSG